MLMVITWLIAEVNFDDFYCWSQIQFHSSGGNNLFYRETGMSLKRIFLENKKKEAKGRRCHKEGFTSSTIK